MTATPSSAQAPSRQTPAPYEMLEAMACWLQAQRQALLLGDVQAVEAAGDGLRACAAHLRRHAQEVSAADARWQILLADAAAMAQANAAIAVRRAQAAAEGLNHLATWSPDLRQLALGDTYAAPGASGRRVPPSRPIGQA